jgi:multidrug efflux pump subunit AcrA (membrane-fusion protein)
MQFQRSAGARRFASGLKPTRALAVNVALGAVIVAGGVWAYQTVWGGGTANAASAASAGSRRGAAEATTVSETASTSGTVASSDVVSANFTTSGTVTKIYVKLGQTVTKGDKLARVDATPANQQLATADDNLTAAQDSLSRAKDSGDTASIDTAQTQVDSAEDAVTTARAAVDGAVLYAPISGTVIAQNGVVGASSSSSSGSGSGSGGGSGSGSGASSSTSSSSSSSTGFIRIANLKKMEVDTDFPEADATKLKAGQKATVSWNALTGATATGVVESIDPTATTSNNVVTYGVVIRLTSLPSGIRIGQTTTVVVTIASKPNVLAVPSTSVTTVGGISFVQKVVNGVATRTQVQVGLVGDSLTEITSGLTAGDQVALPAAATSTSTTTNPFANIGGFGGGGIGGGGITRGGGGGFGAGGGGR